MSDYIDLSLKSNNKKIGTIDIPGAANGEQAIITYLANSIIGVQSVPQTIDFTTQCTIPAGFSVSSEVNLEDGILTDIIVPSGWTAANLTFQASRYGNAGGEDNWMELYADTGSAITVVLTSGAGMYHLTPDTFAGVPFIRIRSGTKAAPVAQAEERVFTVAIWE